MPGTVDSSFHRAKEDTLHHPVGGARHWARDKHPHNRLPHMEARQLGRPGGPAHELISGLIDGQTKTLETMFSLIV